MKLRYLLLVLVGLVIFASSVFALGDEATREIRVEGKAVDFYYQFTDKWYYRLDDPYCDNYVSTLQACGDFDPNEPHEDNNYQIYADIAVYMDTVGIDSGLERLCGLAIDNNLELSVSNGIVDKLNCVADLKLKAKITEEAKTEESIGKVSDPIRVEGIPQGFYYYRYNYDKGIWEYTIFYDVDYLCDEYRGLLSSCGFRDPVAGVTFEPEARELHYNLSIQDFSRGVDVLCKFAVERKWLLYVEERAIDVSSEVNCVQALEPAAAFEGDIPSLPRPTGTGTGTGISTTTTSTVCTTQSCKSIDEVWLVLAQQLEIQNRVGQIWIGNDWRPFNSVHGAQTSLGSALISDWRFDPGIESQWNDASPELLDFLSCMRDQIKSPNTGIISGISDSAGFTRCQSSYAKPPCHHAQNSAHYGCGHYSKSLAVDFGDEINTCAIVDAASNCGISKEHIFGRTKSEYVAKCGSKYTQDNTLAHENHIHVSVRPPSGDYCR